MATGILQDSPRPTRPVYFSKRKRLLCSLEPVYYIQFQETEDERIALVEQSKIEAIGKNPFGIQCKPWVRPTLLTFHLLVSRIGLTRLEECATFIQPSLDFLNAFSHIGREDLPRLPFCFLKDIQIFRGSLWDNSKCCCSLLFSASSEFLFPYG